MRTAAMAGLMIAGVCIWAATRPFPSADDLKQTEGTLRIAEWNHRKTPSFNLALEHESRVFFISRDLFDSLGRDVSATAKRGKWVSIGYVDGREMVYTLSVEGEPIMSLDEVRANDKRGRRVTWALAVGALLMSALMWRSLRKGERAAAVPI